MTPRTCFRGLSGSRRLRSTSLEVSFQCQQSLQNFQISHFQVPHLPFLCRYPFPVCRQGDGQAPFSKPRRGANTPQSAREQGSREEGAQVARGQKKVLPDRGQRPEEGARSKRVGPVSCEMYERVSNFKCIRILTLVCSEAPRNQKPSAGENNCAQEMTNQIAFLRLIPVVPMLRSSCCRVAQ